MSQADNRSASTDTNHEKTRLQRTAAMRESILFGLPSTRITRTLTQNLPLSEASINVSVATGAVEMAVSEDVTADVVSPVPNLVGVDKQAIPVDGENIIQVIA